MADINRNDNVLQNVAAALKDFDFNKVAAAPTAKRICKRCNSAEAHNRMSLCLSCSYC